MQSLSLRAQALLYYGTQMPNHLRKWWVHNKLRQLLRVNVTGNYEVCRSGMYWSLNPADYGHTSLFWLGIKDQWVINALRNLIYPGDVILEAGANFGFFALSLAAYLRGQCQVHVCEPCPTNFDKLQKNISLNNLDSFVYPHRSAFAQAPGCAELIVAPDNEGHARFHRVENGPFAFTTLDQFCEEQSLKRLDLLILDVEGYEEQSLLGGLRTLSRFKPIVVVELWRPVMSLENSNPEQVAELLQKQGYSLYEPIREQLQPLRELPVGDRGIYAFAFPPGSSPKIK